MPTHNTNYPDKLFNRIKTAVAIEKEKGISKYTISDFLREAADEKLKRGKL